MDLSGFKNENSCSSSRIQYNDIAVGLESLEMDSLVKDENYSDLESDEEDEVNLVNQNKNVVRPKFNEWKGQEIDLHLLGPFDSEFNRKIKGMVRPEVVHLKLDPFYRNDYPNSGEPVQGNIYRIWRNSHTLDSGTKEENTSKIEFPIREVVEKDVELYSTKNRGYEEDDEGKDQFPLVGYEPLDLESSESETEKEISEFIESLKAKRKDGANVTGESLWFDESKDMIRNVHENSYSLTSYTPPDNNLFGKRNILTAILTPSELKMLQPLEIQDDNDDK